MDSGVGSGRMRGSRGKGSCCIELWWNELADTLKVGNMIGKIERLTLRPHVLVATAITGGISRTTLALLLLIASKHVVKEVELGLGDSHQQEESPEGL